MAELLLINPRRRKAAKKTAKRRVRRAATGHAKAATVARRRRNPIGLARVHGKRRARRRNPIGLAGAGSIVTMLKNAAVGGAGALAVDVIMGQINGYLPDSMRTKQTGLGVGDAVKIGVTVALGTLLNKPTRGLSKQMAAGALTVQARDILSTFVPGTMALGFATAGKVINGNARVSPIMQRMGAYQPNTPAPMLNAYSQGASPMLSGARHREGVTNFR